MTNEIDRDRPARNGFTQVPNRLLTDPSLSNQEFRFLVWLHSHSPGFLAKMSMRTCAELFGGGNRTRQQLIPGLAEKGWLQVTQPKRGHSAKIILLMDPWEDAMFTGPVEGPLPLGGGPVVGPQGGPVVGPQRTQVLEDQSPPTPQGESGNVVSAEAQAVVKAYYEYHEKEVGRKTTVSYGRMLNTAELMLKAGWTEGQLKRALAHRLKQGWSVWNQNDLERTLVELAGKRGPAAIQPGAVPKEVD